MKRITSFFCILISFCVSIHAQTRKITILHTNDLHSHIIGFGPESSYSPLTINDDNTVGGFSRIASVIKSAKEKGDGITLAIDAGDFLMGTLFQGIEKESGFQLRLMKSMGYDITCLGNHEYDNGPEWLGLMVQNAHENGEIPKILIGNAVFSTKDNRDDVLEKLVADNVMTRKMILEKDGIKFGFFSLLGKDAVKDSPRAVPVTFEKQIHFAAKMVKELRDEKCDIVICVSHSGVTFDKNEWKGEDVDLATKVKGIDVIISGHTHTQLTKPLIINNVPIVQTGEFGEFIGELTLTYSPGKVLLDSYTLIPVDDKISGDVVTENLIALQKDRVTKKILAPLGMSYDNPVCEASFVLEGNDSGDFMASNLGPLIADAIHSYINNHTTKGTDISMVAAGVLRDKILPGKLTAPDIFRVMSLGSGKDNVPGYALSRMYITGKELKSVLEILQIAYKSSPDNYCYYSGIKVEYNPDKGLFRKIKKIGIVKSDGTLINVDFSRKNKTLYSVTANSYMLEFMGIIKKMSFGLVNVTPKNEKGEKVDVKNIQIDMDESKPGIQEGKEWLALMEFLGSMKDTNGDGIPDIDSRYGVPIRCFIPVNQK
jgi:5'-nucleotidase / UDP-sugar diphosphatase